MKTKPILFLLFLLPVFMFTSPVKMPIQSAGIQLLPPRQGTAIIMTGAAARIPQEAALLEELDRRGLLKDVVFISGVSSGALNAVILNGILSEKWTWERYRSVLYGLSNDDIFIQENKKIPVDTDPARALYKRIVEDSLGYHSMGELPFCTSLSFTHISDLYLKKTVYRMCSRSINEETDTSLNVVDIMMASSAFPIVFPPVKISNVTTIPDETFVDGGIGDDHIPYQALLQFEKERGYGVARVYIISRKSDSIPEISEELKVLGVNDDGILDKMHLSIDEMLLKGIEKHLHQYTLDAPELVPLTYIWIPDYCNNFLMFNFDHLKEQYEVTSQWAKTHDPLLLEDFLNRNH